MKSGEMFVVKVAYFCFFITLTLKPQKHNTAEFDVTEAVLHHHNFFNFNFDQRMAAINYNSSCRPVR